MAFSSRESQGFGPRKTSPVPGQRKKTIRVENEADLEQALQQMREVFAGSVGENDKGYLTFSIEYGTRDA